MSVLSSWLYPTCAAVPGVGKGCTSHCTLWFAFDQNLLLRQIGVGALSTSTGNISGKRVMHLWLYCQTSTVHSLLVLLQQCANELFCFCCRMGMTPRALSGGRLQQGLLHRLPCLHRPQPSLQANQALPHKHPLRR